MKVPTAAVAVIFLAAVSVVTPVSGQPAEPEKWRASVTVRQPGEFDKYVGIKSVEGTAGDYFNRPAMTWFINSSVDKTSGARSHSLLFFHSYQAEKWRHWDGAVTDDAKDMQVVSMKRNVDSCDGRFCKYYEVIAIPLDEPLLESRRGKGFKLRLRAEDGDSFVLTLAGDLIGDQVAAARSYSAAIAPLPAPPKSRKK